jgi:hypothetical protein
MSNIVAIQQFLPCVPSAMTWDEWLGNFAIYYGQYNIQFSDEENWREAADHLASEAKFGIYPLPPSADFATWQEWADDVSTIINGPPIYQTNNVPIFWENNSLNVVNWANARNNNVNWVK